MLLAIDAGNTNIVFGVFENDMLRSKWRVETTAFHDVDAYAQKLRAAVDPKSITATILGSVVSDVVMRSKGFCTQHLGIELVVVGECGVIVGIDAKIDAPEKVGVDRMINAFAAKSRYGAPLIAVDMGTATTF